LTGNPIVGYWEILADAPAALVSRSSGSTSPWEAVLQATANSRQKFPNIQYE
jgi:hypothetical protein